MRTKEIKIGVFVVSVLVISFFVINYLRGKDIFGKEAEFCAEYDNVEGLVVSAPVYVKGYKAGKVTEVRYMPQSERFKVTCSVDKDFRVPEDSRMTIYAVDIMGGKGIRIDLGTSDVTATDGATLSSSFEAGLLDGLAGSLQPLLAKLTNTLDSLGTTVSSVNALLSESNRTLIGKTMTHLERTLADISSIAAGINGKSSELNLFIDNLAHLSSKLGNVADKADTLVSGVSSVVDTIDEADIAEVLASFKSLLEKMNDPDGTIGKFLVDGSVYNSLDELLTDVDSLVKKIQENPKKYIKISVF